MESSSYRYIHTYEFFLTFNITGVSFVLQLKVKVVYLKASPGNNGHETYQSCAGEILWQNIISIEGKRLICLFYCLLLTLKPLMLTSVSLSDHYNPSSLHLSYWNTSVSWSGLQLEHFYHSHRHTIYKVLLYLNLLVWEHTNGRVLNPVGALYSILQWIYLHLFTDLFYKDLSLPSKTKCSYSHLEKKKISFYCIALFTTHWQVVLLHQCCTPPASFV